MNKIGDRVCSLIIKYDAIWILVLGLYLEIQFYTIIKVHQLAT